MDELGFLRSRGKCPKDKGGAGGSKETNTPTATHMIVTKNTYPSLDVHTTTKKSPLPSWERARVRGNRGQWAAATTPPEYKPPRVYASANL